MIGRTVDAQLRAEVLNRLRATRTIVVFAVLFVLSIAYVPDPRSNATSISWETKAGETFSGVYNSAYLGATTAILSSILLSLIGFYLVFGSVRRDVETRVWSIVASTPTSRASYLAGKFVAHYAYLLLLSLVCVLSGTILFALYGVGPFHLADFIRPWFALLVPGLAWTAAFAILFDVTPGLRKRAGGFIWFFVWTFLVSLPMFGSGKSIPSFDPTGFPTVAKTFERTLPLDSHGMSFGYQFRDTPVRRVEWKGFTLTPEMAAQRMVSLSGAVIPFALAVLVFSVVPTGTRPPRERKKNGEIATIATGMFGERSGDAIKGVRAPSFARAIFAETILLWQSAPKVRWIVVAAAIVGAVAPAPASSGAIAVFLLFVGPIISEAASRETLAGTERLVFPSPSISSTVYWKLASVGAFLFAIGAPILLRRIIDSPAAGVQFALALLLVTSLAVALGLVSGGGKFFSGAYSAWWYLSIRSVPSVDFSGVFKGPSGGGMLVDVVAIAILVSLSIAMSTLPKFRRAA